ncbi:putative gustatory receptor 2a [Culicoides brevitarsis]|uniref:putative gustatory receptor 2a n=1 Tax=Culicoides brevitarsis TaxID=469753 RepID=UPI00307B742E
MLTEFAIEHETEVLIDENHEWIGLFVIYVCFYLLFIINTTTSFGILLQKQKQFTFLKRLQELRDKILVTGSRNFERKLTATVVLSSLVVLINPVVSVKVNLSHLPTTVMFLYIFLLVTLQAHYFVGHLFEMVLVENVRFLYSVLLNNRSEDPLECSLRKFITTHADLWKLSVFCIRLFDINKVICLAALTILMAIYWFFQYDLHEMSIWPPLCWQMIVSVVFVTCHSWHRLANEAQKTVECVARLDIESIKDAKTRKCVQNFLLKNLHEEKKFTACGFFVVDNSIIFTVFSSIITYLLILVQFKQLEEGMSEN